MLVARYKTKALLKASVGKRLNYSETTLFGSEYQGTGKFAVVGPSAYERKWYAEVTIERRSNRKGEVALQKGEWKPRGGPIPTEPKKSATL